MTRKFSNIVTSIALIGTLVISSIISIPMTSKAEITQNNNNPEIIDVQNIDSFSGLNDTVGAIYVDPSLKFYDPRVYNRVSSVKNQGSLGWCGGYAIVACAESYLITHGYETKDVDLSELYYAYDTWNNSGSSASLKDWAMSESLVNKKDGEEFITRFAYESDFPTPATMADNYSYTSNELENYKYKISKVFRLGKYSPTEEKINLVKEMVSNFGGVTYNFSALANGYWGNKSTDKYTDCNYYAGSYDDNRPHAVEIVGWDDNYDASNFVASPKPKGNGAWLVKNSWGTGEEKREQVGDYTYIQKNERGSGYIWISYYNTPANNLMYAFELVKKGEPTYVSSSHTIEGDVTTEELREELAKKIGETPYKWEDDGLPSYPSKKWNTAFGTFTSRAYDSYGNLLGKFNITVIPSKEAVLDVKEEDRMVYKGEQFWLKYKGYVDNREVDINYEYDENAIQACGSEYYVQFIGDEDTVITATWEYNGNVYKKDIKLSLYKDEVEEPIAEDIPYEDYTPSLPDTPQEEPIPYTPEPTPINTNPVTIVTPGNTNTPISETSNVISGKELAKMIRKPSLKAEGKKKSIKLKIGDTGASYYEVKVSTSKKFTKKSTKVLKAYDTTYTVKKLKKNTTYYVKVRGVVYGEKGKWSKIKEVKTKK